MDTTKIDKKPEPPLRPLVPEPRSLVELARRALARSRALRESAYALTLVVDRKVLL